MARSDYKSSSGTSVACTLLAVLIRCDVLPVVAYSELLDNIAFAGHASLVAAK